MRDLTGNLPTLPGVFPDYSAPIVRTAVDGVRELTMTRWGMPSPIFALKDRKSDPGVTNIRNVGSPHWRRWLGAESRCVVPFTSFAEHEVLPDGSRPPVWFALDEGRPLAFFAGFWTLDVSAQGEGRRNDKRPLRFPDDGAQRRRRANPPQGHAGHFNEDRRNRGFGLWRRLRRSLSCNERCPTTRFGSSRECEKRHRVRVDYVLTFYDSPARRRLAGKNRPTIGKNDIAKSRYRNIRYRSEPRSPFCCWHQGRIGGSRAGPVL
jgi:hypothetical protein